MAAISLRVKAPVDQVWRVLGDRFGDVHRILPSLSASRLRTDGPPGVGAARVCTLARPVMGMTSVEERVTAWEEGRAFSYTVDTAPWPIATVSNTWTLEPDGAETILTLTPALRLRGGAIAQPLAPLVLRAMSRSLEKDLPLVVEAIERECAALEKR